MDSLEKLNRTLLGANQMEPDDEHAARLLQLLQLAGPMLGTVIPDTAEEFDQQLIAIARMALEMRSDDAELGEILGFMEDLTRPGRDFAGERS